MVSKPVRGLSARLQDLPAARGAGPRGAREAPPRPGRGPAARPGTEYARGWGVFALPFASGHVLVLRVFPASSFGPYRARWHRDPAGRWSIYVDGPRLDTACPRYFGPAAHATGYARIGLTWTGPATLRVTMDAPALEWTLTATSTRILALLNAMSAAMPQVTWRLRPLVRARERLAGALGMGQLRLTGTMPSGHTGMLMPGRMYFIDAARATLDGADLGPPARWPASPVIGGVPLPARGVLATGQAVFTLPGPAGSERAVPAGPVTRLIPALARGACRRVQTGNETGADGAARLPCLAGG
jgi:hypothetical protein